MEKSVFSNLMELPLLQGMGIEEVSEIGARMKLDFRKLKKGQAVAHENDSCTSLAFLLRGELCVETQNNNRTLTLHEPLLSPALLQVESLFGLRTRYTRNFYANTDVQLLYIHKEDITGTLLNYEVFRFNYLNLLSTNLQNAQRLLRQDRPSSLLNSFIYRIRALCLRPAGPKELHVKMQDLADELGETRLNISRMLHRLAQQNLLQTRRQGIIIPSLEKIIQAQGE